MWHNKKVSVCIITKDNGTSIRDLIEDIFHTGFVDEVLVADTGSRDRTISEISYTKARIITARDYVNAFYQTIEKSTGNYAIFIDPSGLIPGDEVAKLLPYSKEQNAVFTSRMGWLGFGLSKADKKYSNYNKKIGNKISSTLETVLFDDVNSYLFLLDKDILDVEKFKFSLGKNLFVFEIMKNSLENGLSHIQIPCEFHSSLESTDSKLFSFFNMHQMKKAISNIDKSFRRKALRNLSKNHDEPETEDGGESLNPEIIKQRIASLRKRLGAADESTASLEAKKKIENAVKKISKPTLTQGKLTLEEELIELKKLEIGLSSKRSVKKKNRHKNSHNKPSKNL